jgi:hypothetical protein
MCFSALRLPVDQRIEPTVLPSHLESGLASVDGDTSFVEATGIFILSLPVYIFWFSATGTGVKVPNVSPDLEALEIRVNVV